MTLSAASPDLALALNGFPGVKKVQLRGRNAAISNAYETVWLPGATYARLSSATALEVVSSTANDAAAGTGARTVVVESVLASGAVSTETVTLNGTTAVALVATTTIAVNRFYVATVGSGASAAGTIDCRTVSGSTIKSQIITTADILGRNLATDFIYTIPTGYTGVLKTVEFSATGVTGDLTCVVEVTTSDGITFNAGAGKSSLYVTGFNGAMGKVHFGVGQVIPALAQIELRALVSAGAGDLVAMADLFLIDANFNHLGGGQTFLT